MGWGMIGESSVREEEEERRSCSGSPPVSSHSSTGDSARGSGDDSKGWSPFLPTLLSLKGLVWRERGEGQRDRVLTSLC